MGEKQGRWRTSKIESLFLALGRFHFRAFFPSEFQHIQMSASSSDMSTERMLQDYGILAPEEIRSVMNETNAFFAGGACLALARSRLTRKWDFDPKGDLDIWVPCFNHTCVTGYSYEAHGYNKLALALFKNVLEKCGFKLDIKSGARSDPTYRFGVRDEKNAKCSYKIWRVDTYSHGKGGQKVQVIGVHSYTDSVLLTPLQIVAGFDISICRCFVTTTQWAEVQAPTGILEEVKRGVFSVLPLDDLPNRDRTAMRVAKYYGRGYVMEERVVRALTEVEAIAYVAASMPPTPPTPVTPVPKNTVRVSELPTTPVKEPKPDAPRLVLVEEVAKKLFEAGKYVAYYKDLKPLLGEKTILVNLEKDGRLTTIRLYESILRKALTNLAPHNKGVGKHLVYWRGATQFADYVTDMACEMIQEMATSEA